jgi:hypothetical protein
VPNLPKFVFSVCGVTFVPFAKVLLPSLPRVELNLLNIFVCVNSIASDTSVSTELFQVFFER